MLIKNLLEKFTNMRFKFKRIDIFQWYAEYKINIKITTYDYLIKLDHLPKHYQLHFQLSQHF